MPDEKTRWIELAERLAGFGRPVQMVEVGVWDGINAGRVMEAVPDVTMILVDSWDAVAPGTDYRRSGDGKAMLPQETFNFARANAFKIAEKFVGRCSIMDMSSEEAAVMVADLSVDLVFIDANHSYNGATSDLNAWWTKVVPGGYISGHDWRYPYGGFKVAEAVLDFIAPKGLGEGDVEIGGDYTWFLKMEGFDR